MSNDNVNITNVDIQYEANSMSPVPYEERSLTPIGLSMVYWSSLIAVQIITIGLFLMYPNGPLNIVQLGVAAVISGIIFSVIMALAGEPGAKYGIPFMVQIRSAFGLKGAKLVGILRSIPAIIWNGIATWYGAEAMSVVTNTIFGWGNPFVYFAILLIIETVLCATGFETVAWFDKFMSIVIYILLAYFFINLLAKGSLDFSAALEYEGSWGAPFIFACLTGISHMSACLMNGADLARNVKWTPGKERSENIKFLVFGALPPWLVMFAFGIIINVQTGLTDPITGLSMIAPNALFAVLLMVFLCLAQVTTNLSLNHLVGSLVFKDLFNWKWKNCAIVVGILSCITCPWYLASSSGFNWIMNIASMFLGPLVAIMLADYFVVRHSKMNMKALYDGSYTYTNGWNVPSMISFVAGWICAIIFANYAWFVGFAVAFISYLVMKLGMHLDADKDFL